MRLHNFTYLLKEGARNVVSNKLMSLASIGVLMACLLLIGSATLFSLNVNSIVRYVEQQNEVVAFLEEDLTREDVQVLELTLGQMDNILETTYISKDAALEQQKADIGPEFEGLLDGLEDDNPLLDRFILRVGDPSRIENTVAALRATDGILKVNAATEVSYILAGLKRAVTVAGMTIVAILVVVSVVIITNTIKLTVFSRRKEINIMKYVGATDLFIRMPFLVEGMLIGLLAATLAFLMLGYGYTYLLEWIGENYAVQLPLVIDNAIDFWEFAPQLLAGFAGLGVFIGVVGSGVFVRKYLKV